MRNGRPARRDATTGKKQGAEGGLAASITTAGRKIHYLNRALKALLGMSRVGSSDETPMRRGGAVVVFLASIDHFLSDVIEAFQTEAGDRVVSRWIVTGKNSVLMHYTSAPGSRDS